MVGDSDIARIPGWFHDVDVALFRLLLPLSAERVGGDLAELGVYLGKSAVLIGDHVGPDDVFTVVDLFGDAAPDSANLAENDEQYAGLTRAAFEREYLRVHDELPVVVQAPSGELAAHARRGRHRFVHVDASHLYEHVVGDVAVARELLAPDGIVVFDDYRSEHTPGVSAAVWGAVADDLRPFALSPVKMYATFGDAAPWSAAVRGWAEASPWASEEQVVAGSTVVRVWAAADAERTAPTSSVHRGPVRRVAGRVRRAFAG